jgi:hypothetical protein
MVIACSYGETDLSPNEQGLMLSDLAYVASICVTLRDK